MCVELSWDGGATWTAAQATPTLGATEATFILGSNSDTWGRTWSDTEFTNATSRSRLRSRCSVAARNSAAETRVRLSPPSPGNVDTGPVYC